MGSKSKKGVSIEEEHAYLVSQNLSQYAGRWLAVFGKKIIADGKTLKEVANKVIAQNIDDQAPLYMLVPTGAISS